MPTRDDLRNQGIPLGPDGRPMPITNSTSTEYGVSEEYLRANGIDPGQIKDFGHRMSGNDIQSSTFYMKDGTTRELGREYTTGELAGIFDGAAVTGGGIGIAGVGDTGRYTSFGPGGTYHAPADPGGTGGGAGGGGGAAGGASSFENQANLLFPYLPAELRKIFIDAWAEFGSTANSVGLALAKMRQSPAYEHYYPGNKRADGTVRADEAGYASTVEGLNRRRAHYGMSPLSPEQQLKLITGDVSPNEYEARLDDGYLKLVSNIDAVRKYYADNFGAGNLSDSALFESYTDPSISPLEAQRRLTAAEIGGEASLKGYNVARSEAERLASFGLDQQAARSLYSEISSKLPTLQELQARFADPNDPLTADQYAEARVLNDPNELRHMTRLFGQQRSQFSQQSLFTPGRAGGQGGLLSR